MEPGNEARVLWIHIDDLKKKIRTTAFQIKVRKRSGGGVLDYKPGSLASPPKSARAMALFTSS